MSLECERNLETQTQGLHEDPAAKIIPTMTHNNSISKDTNTTASSTGM